MLNSSEIAGFFHPMYCLLVNKSVITSERNTFVQLSQIHARETVIAFSSGGEIVLGDCNGSSYVTYTHKMFYTCQGRFTLKRGALDYG